MEKSIKETNKSDIDYKGLMQLLCFVIGLILFSMLCAINMGQSKQLNDQQKQLDKIETVLKTKGLWVN